VGAEASRGNDPLRRLLLIDDDPRLATILTAYLRQHGFELAWADRPSKGLVLLADRPELILLDVMLPERDGFEVCRHLRVTGDLTPIIMLTGRGADDDRIHGLDLGADDYLPKPFNHRELVSRIEAVLRRRLPAPIAQDGLDAERRLLCLDGREIPLTAMEFKLLEHMATRPGRVFARGELISLVDETGASESFDRAIDSHIFRLRSKIEADPKAPSRLLTVRGIGYTFQW
jgi:DNA-binding response OmpR family regulator